MHTPSRSSHTRPRAKRARRAVRSGTTLALLALVLSTLVTASAAQETAQQPQGVACPSGEVAEDGFADVPDTNVHEAAVDCVVWWAIANGTTASTYEPAGAVRRDQMAAFLSRLLDAAGVQLPDNPSDAFADDDANTHELAINQLAALELVNGTTATTYSPATTVRREQMASFLVRTYEHVTDTTVSTSTNHFSDDDTSAHHANINRAAEIEVAGGKGDGTYAPRQDVRRDQMATFLTRLLDALDLVHPDLGDRPTLACEQEGYPCSWAEASGEAWHRSLELLDEVTAALRDATDADKDPDAAVEEAAAVVDAHADVVDVTYDETNITFRVDGGVPVVALTGFAGFGVVEGGEPTATVESLESGTSSGTTFSSQGFDQAGPEGEGNDDGGKSAVIIDPYGNCRNVPTWAIDIEYVPAPGDATDGQADRFVKDLGGDCDRNVVSQSTLRLAEMFRDNRQYSTVHLYVGDAVTPAVMQNLGSYDAVQIQSHGWDGGVIVDLLGSFRVTDGKLSAYQHDGTEVDSSQLPTGVTVGADQDGRPGLAYTTDFFTDAYPFGLTETIVYAGWCKSAAGSITRHLAGPFSVSVGWTAKVLGVDNDAASQRFWQLLVDDAVDTGIVKDVLDDEGLGATPHAAMQMYAPSDGGLRALDAVRSYQDDRPIAAETELDWKGTIEDGANDHLEKFSVVVRGVKHGTKDQVSIEILVDGEKLEEELTLQDATPVVQQSRWSDWEVTAEDLELPFDMTPDKLRPEAHEWKVQVRDGERGHAVHRVEPVYFANEKIEVVDPEFFAPLVDEQVVPIPGTERDGQPDEAPVVLEVTDPEVEAIDEYRVETTVSGPSLHSDREFDEPLSAFTELDEHTFRREHMVQLDEDITGDNDRLTITTVLLRNGQERSRDEVTVVLDGEDVEKFEITWDGDFWNTYADVLEIPPQYYTTAGSVTGACTNPPVVPDTGNYEQIEVVGSAGHLAAFGMQNDVAVGFSKFGPDEILAVGETGTFSVEVEFEGPHSDDYVDPTYVGTGQVTITDNEVTTVGPDGEDLPYPMISTLVGTFQATGLPQVDEEHPGGSVDVSGSFTYDVESCLGLSLPPSVES